MHVLTQETIINRPIEEVFNFFSKAENLNLITPEELKFKMHTPSPVLMQKGTLIDYTIKVSGIPFKWRTEITAWDPPFRFIDEQKKGPYNTWIHEHTFESLGPDKTKMTDHVQFLSPGWILEPLIHHLFINKKVQGIFRFRNSKLAERYLGRKAL